MKIYVASSWKNKKFESVLKRLDEAGIGYYNFREANLKFHWRDIDPNWESWIAEEFIHSLRHPYSQIAFGNDYEAMRQCDALLLVMPCGNSAHLEAGWFAGQNKPVIILLESSAPDLMYLMGDAIVANMDDAIEWINKVVPKFIEDMNKIAGAGHQSLGSFSHEERQKLWR